MIELIRISNPVTLQITCDALDDKKIVYRVENAGMNALLPVPDLMSARILIDDESLAAAEQIISDLERL